MRETPRIRSTGILHCHFAVVSSLLKHTLNAPRSAIKTGKKSHACGGSLPLLLLEEDDLDDERDEEEEVDVLLEDEVDETDEDLLLLRFRFLFSFP